MPQVRRPIDIVLAETKRIRDLDKIEKSVKKPKRKPQPRKVSSAVKPKPEPKKMSIGDRLARMESDAKHVGDAARKRDYDPKNFYVDMFFPPFFV